MLINIPSYFLKTFAQVYKICNDKENDGENRELEVNMIAELNIVCFNSPSQIGSWCSTLRTGAAKTRASTTF